MPSYEDKLKDQAQPYLEPGEQVLSAIIAQPRGTTTARAGGNAGSVFGGRSIKRARNAGAETGLELTSPMALALTDRRLLVLSITAPIALGKGGDVTDLVSAAPIGDVESIAIKRLLVGKIVTVTVRGTPIALEAGAGADAKGLLAAFEQITTAA